MLGFAADENFNMHIVNGVLRRLPNLDIRRVQDAGLEGTDDRAVLEWAASEGRVLLTHDANTITAFAYERIAQGLPDGCAFRSDSRTGSGRLACARHPPQIHALNCAGTSIQRFRGNSHSFSSRP